MVCFLLRVGLVCMCVGGGLWQFRMLPPKTAGAACLHGACRARCRLAASRAGLRTGRNGLLSSHTATICHTLLCGIIKLL